MQPFTWRTLLVLVTIPACYAAAHYLVHWPNPLLEAIFQSAVYVLLCAVLILSLRISEDANRLLVLGIEKVRAFRKK